MGPVIRVLLLEDEALIRQGIARLLGRQKEIDVVADASTVGEVLAAVKARRDIDVIVADVMLGDDPGGLDLLAAIHGLEGHPPVLLLSSFGEPWMYEAALKGGALGYLLKGSALAEVVSAIRSVAAGVAVFPGAALRDRVSPRAPSEREAEVMRLVANGFGNGEIGARLGIKQKTVESHLTRLYSRYGLASRTELAMYASKHGWIGRPTARQR